MSGHSGIMTTSDFNNMADAELLALPKGTTNYGGVDLTEQNTRKFNNNGNNYTFEYSHIHKYGASIEKSVDTSTILNKTTITFAELLAMTEYTDKYGSNMVGKLVTGLTNSLYSGSYRVIGYNHDGSSNTYDLLTEDCVQKASSGFGKSNRHYNDTNCYARIFAEETFYNAFDSSIKEHIKPMEVKYYYKDSTGVTGGTLQTTTAYGKLLSYNEVGTTYASSTSQGDKYQYCQNDGAEGNKYPYFNATGSTLSNLRIKKYNGTAVYWWLRSRYTNTASHVGYIYTNGGASFDYYNSTGLYLAPVLRIG